jgi:hypothetical protein
MSGRHQPPRRSRVALSSSAGISDMDPPLPGLMGIERAGSPRPVLSSCPRGRQEPFSRGPGLQSTPPFGVGSPRSSRSEPPRWFDLAPHTLASVCEPRSGRVPGEPLDTGHDLPEQGPCQEAFGKLQAEVPGMPDEPPAGLEQPLLEARQLPTLDGCPSPKRRRPPLVKLHFRYGYWASDPIDDQDTVVHQAEENHRP